jgi:hypothetical protein
VRARLRRIRGDDLGVVRAVEAERRAVLHHRELRVCAVGRGDLRDEEAIRGEVHRRHPRLVALPGHLSERSLSDPEVAAEVSPLTISGGGRLDDLPPLEPDHRGRDDERDEADDRPAVARRRRDGEGDDRRERARPRQRAETRIAFRLRVRGGIPPPAGGCWRG